ncbi:MAG TPA: ATP-binding cassette domain-containing protein, partial [Anaerolineae bacterium]|nr:ATP-binding cassette domain-containing protein [Anaerolineae bacterium]
MPTSTQQPTFYQRLREKMRRRIKTPTVLQMEAVECGAAALGSILAYHKKFVPLEELRTACGVSRDGSKANNMVRAARSYGLLSQGISTEPETLRVLRCPLIIHWNFDHFVVIDDFVGDKVYLNDPAVGPRVVSAEELDQSFTGVVLTFDKGPDFQAGGTKPNIRAALRRRIRHSEIALIFAILVNLTLIVPNLLLPVFARVYVDLVLQQGLLGWMPLLLLGMIATALLRALLTWLQQSVLLRLETKLDITNAARLVWQTVHLPMSFFLQRSAGDISARIDLNNRVAQLLSGEMATTLLNLILLGFYALIMLAYDPYLTLIVVACAVVNVVVLRYVARRRIDASLRMVQEQSKLASTAYMGLQNIEMLKSSGAESDFFSKWAGYQANVINSTQRLAALTEVVSVIPLSLTALANAIVLLWGSASVMDGAMSVGMLVAFQSLTNSFLAPLNQIMAVAGELQEAEALIVRLEDVFNYGAVSTSAESPSPTQTDKLSGQIEIRNLQFGYSRLDAPLIDGFSITIKPGSRVALVGSSGSGKSTVARLIAGLYEPWSGDILLDGTPRGALPKELVAHSVAYVDQDIFLFEGTIRANLAFWNDVVPDQAIVAAAKDAQIHATIVERAEGYAG